MKSNNVFEMIFSGLFLLILVVFLNPFHWWMPTMLVMTLLGCLLFVFIVFGVFVWKEKVGDEREQIHRMLAGRVAFLAGAGVLVVGIIVQELQGKLDRWLIYSLVVMILAKVIALKYSKERF